MKWTTDRPTKPGHYLVRNCSMCREEPEFVRVSKQWGRPDSKRLEMWVIGSEVEEPLESVTAEWLGPLDLEAIGRMVEALSAICYRARHGCDDPVNYPASEIEDWARWGLGTEGAEKPK